VRGAPAAQFNWHTGREHAPRGEVTVILGDERIVCIVGGRASGKRGAELTSYS
jgi:hypothetical protein